MPTVVVHHDQPIAETLRGRRSDLIVARADTREEVISALSQADIFVTNPASWNDDFLDGLSEGVWVQATSTGFAAFPTALFEQRGILFTNAAGNYSVPVADHAFALALGLGRDLPRFVTNKQANRWDRDVGTSLIDMADRRLTIVGLGDIGEAIAQRGLGFDMEVKGVKRDPTSYSGCLSPEDVHASTELYSLLSATDLLVVIVPLTEETHHLIDGEVFQELPETAVVINVSRGPVVDEAALIEALQTGSIGGAGLDVFEEEPLPPESPLWDMDDVIITPHVAGRSQSFVDRFVSLFLDNYDRWISDKPVTNRIV